MKAPIKARFVILALLSFYAMADTSYAFEDTGSLDPFGRTLFFRQVSELYRNENDSVIVFDGAYLDSPNSTGLHVVEFEGHIMQEAQVLLSKISVWVGGVSWLTQPLVQDVQFSGSVVFHVWLESDDPDPSASGIGVGLAIISEQGVAVGEPEYSYQYKFGNYLTTEAREYILTVYFNRRVLASQRIALSLGAGSTVQGWRVKAYFDSLTFPARAEFPQVVYVIPELSHGLTDMIVAASVLLVTLIATRTGRRHRLTVYR